MFARECDRLAAFLFACAPEEQFYTKAGTPQDGVISPSSANISRGKRSRIGSTNATILHTCKAERAYEAND
ncbi:hypothetical protein [Sorangium sp. So ce341]|uniref:hypothetical protein n=1 Tax=Sorangium sp. So ce341 TaxID=3133302 RepID=UPI003F64901C